MVAAADTELAQCPPEVGGGEGSRTAVQPGDEEGVDQLVGEVGGQGGARGGRGREDEVCHRQQVAADGLAGRLRERLPCLHEQGLCDG